MVLYQNRFLKGASTFCFQDVISNFLKTVWNPVICDSIKLLFVVWLEISVNMYYNEYPENFGPHLDRRTSLFLTPVNLQKRTSLVQDQYRTSQDLLPCLTSEPCINIFLEVSSYIMFNTSMILHQG